MKKIENLKSLLYVLPAILLFGVFTFYPFIMNAIQSLYISDNLGNMLKYNGFNNYKLLFKNPIYKKTLLNTFVYVITTVPLTIIISTALSILVYEYRGKSKIFSLIFSSTMGISVASASLFWSFILHPTMGVLNKLIELIGASPIGWLTDPQYALYSVSAVTIWMNIGFSFIILLGGIRNIDRSLYESADILGVGFWSRTFRITVPLLSPSLFFVSTVNIIGSFQSFGVIDMLTTGGPINSTNVLIYNLYKDAFKNHQYGLATSEGIVLFIIILIISILQTKLSEKWVTYQ